MERFRSRGCRVGSVAVGAQTAGLCFLDADQQQMGAAQKGVGAGILMPNLGQFHDMTDRRAEIRGELFLVAERLNWSQRELETIARYLSNEPQGETMPRCETEYR